MRNYILTAAAICLVAAVSSATVILSLGRVQPAFPCESVVVPVYSLFYEKVELSIIHIHYDPNVLDFEFHELGFGEHQLLSIDEVSGVLSFVDPYPKSLAYQDVLFNLIFTQRIDDATTTTINFDEKSSEHIQEGSIEPMVGIPTFVESKSCPSKSVSIDTMICKGTLFNGQTVFQDETLQFTYESSCHICDSIIILNVNIIEPKVDVVYSGIDCEAEQIKVDVFSRQGMELSNVVWSSGMLGNRDVLSWNEYFYVHGEVEHCPFELDSIFTHNRLIPTLSVSRENFPVKEIRVENVERANVVTYANGELFDDLYNWQVQERDTLNLLLVDSLGCEWDSVLVYRPNKRIYVPNAFSPNADGINDTWQFFNEFVVLEVDLNIYNRYGGKVFTCKGRNCAWDGVLLNGMPAETGTYVYSMIVYDHENYVLKGELHLVR